MFPHGHTDRNDAANCFFCSCFRNVPKVKECDITCLFCYYRGTICSYPTHVVVEQQSSSGHALSYVRKCMCHGKNSRLLFNKIVTIHGRQNTQSLVFSVFVSHYYWSFH